MTDKERYEIAIEVLHEIFMASSEVVSECSTEEMTTPQLIEYYDLAMVMIASQRMEKELLRLCESQTDSLN